MKNILNTLKGPSISFVRYKFTLWHQAGQESLRTQCLPSHPPSLQIDSLLMARVFIIPPKLICETQIRVSNERDLLLTELIVPITSYYSHKTKQKLDITHHTFHITLSTDLPVSAVAPSDRVNTSLSKSYTGQHHQLSQLSGSILYTF